MRRFRSTSSLLVAVLFVLGSGGTALADDVYSFDTDHSHVLFTYNHLGLSTQHARFTGFDGTVVFDQENLANSSIDVTIDAASVHTITTFLDDDLKSANFFDVANYPEITFKSTSARQTGADTGIIVGDLTIKDQTNPVTLFVTFNFSGIHPLSEYFPDYYGGAEYASFSAHTTVLRSDFGVGLYAPLTSDEVEIRIEAELRKQD